MPQLLVNSALAADTARTIVAQQISLPAVLALIGMAGLAALVFFFRTPLPPHPFYKSRHKPLSD